jgi:CoA-transferase family III
MTKLMSGVRVIEVASWTFVPAAGAVLADWGADVLKIEHPDAPDPQRHLVSTGFGGAGSSKSFIMEQSNRGKRSVALNLATPGGLELLYRLVDTADVFLTNFLPRARQKLKIDVEHIRARKSSTPAATARAPSGPTPTSRATTAPPTWRAAPSPTRCDRRGRSGRSLGRPPSGTCPAP